MPSDSPFQKLPIHRSEFRRHALIKSRHRRFRRNTRTEKRATTAAAMSGGGGAGAGEWQRIYDQVETRVEALAAGHARLEARNGIQHEYWEARDNINISRLHKAEFSRSRWEAACNELLPGDHPKITELLESDLEDSRSVADYFDGENSDLKVKLKEVEACVDLCQKTVDHEQIRGDLRELRKVLQGYESLCADKDKKVSTLLAEKDFLRNQLRAMERDNAALLKMKQVEGAQATEAIHRLQKNVEELQVAALAAKNKLLVAEGKLEEMHCLAKEKDIENLKDGQLKSLKRKRAPLSNLPVQKVRSHGNPTSAVALKASTSTHEVRKSKKTCTPPSPCSLPAPPSSKKRKAAHDPSSKMATGNKSCRVDMSSGVKILEPAAMEPLSGKEVPEARGNSRGSHAIVAPMPFGGIDGFNKWMDVHTEDNCDPKVHSNIENLVHCFFSGMLFLFGSLVQGLTGMAEADSEAVSEQFFHFISGAPTRSHLTRGRYLGWDPVVIPSTEPDVMKGSEKHAEPIVHVRSSPRGKMAMADGARNDPPVIPLKAKKVHSHRKPMDMKSDAPPRCSPRHQHQAQASL